MSNLTIKQLLGNAPGAFTRQVAPRYLIIAKLEQEFKALVKRKDRGKFVAVAFFTNDNNVRVWIKVPSTKYVNISYDVVLDLDFTESNYITNATVKYYTNSPAWMFTYAFVANENEYIIDELKDYVSDKALTEDPRITNPTASFGFEKVTHFALLCLTEVMGVRVKNDLKRLTDRKLTFNPEDIKNFSTEDKLNEYELEKSESVKANKVNKLIAKKLEKNINDALKKDGNSTNSKFVKPRRAKAPRKSKPPRKARNHR